MNNDERAELLAEIEYLKGVIESYGKREEEIAAAEEKARKEAERIENAARKLFDLEADRLRLFKLAWDRKFAALERQDREKLRKLNELALDIDDVISGKGKYSELSYREKTDELRRLVDENGKLIDGEGVYLGNGRDGFSLDEVLNPKEDIDLEALCREMGLMEE